MNRLWALACPVCFGASDSLLAQGSNWGILALLGVTFGMLGAFGAFFMHLRKRSKLMPEPGADLPGYETQRGNV